MVLLPLGQEEVPTLKESPKKQIEEKIKPEKDDNGKAGFYCKIQRLRLKLLYIYSNLQSVSKIYLSKADNIIIR